FAIVTGIATTSKFVFCWGAEYWITGGTNTRRSERLSRLSHRLNAENNSAVAENAVVTQAVPSLRMADPGLARSSDTRPSSVPRGRAAAPRQSRGHKCGGPEAQGLTTRRLSLRSLLRNRRYLAVARPRPRPGLHGLDVAVAWRTGGSERNQQSPGNVGDIIERLVERCLIRLCGRREPAQLADELQRGRADLLLGRGRLEIEQRADIAAHRTLLDPAFGPCHIGPWRRRCRVARAIGRPRGLECQACQRADRRRPPR